MSSAFAAQLAIEIPIHSPRVSLTLCTGSKLLRKSWENLESQGRSSRDCGFPARTPWRGSRAAISFVSPTPPVWPNIECASGWSFSVIEPLASLSLFVLTERHRCLQFLVMRLHLVVSIIPDRRRFPIEYSGQSVEIELPGRADERR